MNENVNSNLLKIYKREIENLSSTDNFSIQPAHPFLLSIPTDYMKKTKVMIIGQEPNGWLEDLNYEPEKAMDRYKRFWIDKQSKNSKRGTFQQVLNKFQNMLNKDKVSCIWNNTIKIGKKNDLGTPPKYMIEWQENWFNVIQQEVKLLKPDFIIFLTGPNYDDYIEKSFGKFTKSKVMDKTIRQITKLNFLENEELVAFRTYHPNFLRRSKLEDEFLNYFKQQINSK